MPNLWYVVSAGQVRGPFPAGALIQDRLLGRLEPEDLVSPDRENWQPFSSWPNLTEGLQALSASQGSGADGWEVERAKARARWADERAGSERRSGLDEDASGGERRQLRVDRRTEAVTVSSRKTTSRVRGLFGTEYAIWKVIVGLLCLAALIALMILLFGPVNPIRVRIQ